MYRNFSNPQGALADGTCCDNPGLTPPNCPPDQCDTSFLPCATFFGGAQCAAFFHNPTSSMVDDDSFLLQKKIGNVKGMTSSNLAIFIDYFSHENINFNLNAYDVTDNDTSLIGNFNFIIDWIDTFFSRTDHWRQMVLRDKDVELGLDVVHQCKIYHFGPTCSVYCKPTHQYTCLNDGSKNCTDGWQGPDCTDLVPYCTSGSCQNGGTCTNIHLGFNCSCTSSHSGKQCEHKNPTTTIPYLISSLSSPSNLRWKPPTSTSVYSSHDISNSPIILTSNGQAVMSTLVKTLSTPQPYTSSPLCSSPVISNIHSTLSGQRQITLGISMKTLSTPKYPTSTPLYSSPIISSTSYILSGQKQSVPSTSLKTLSTRKPSTSTPFHSSLSYSNTPNVLSGQRQAGQSTSTKTVPTSKPSMVSSKSSSFTILNSSVMPLAQGQAVLNFTNKTVLTLKTSNSTRIQTSRTGVATFASVGLILLGVLMGVLFATATYLFYNMKKQGFKRKVKPLPSPTHKSQGEPSTRQITV